MTAAAPAPHVGRRLRGLFRRRLGRRLRTPFPDAPGNDIASLGRGEGYFARMTEAIGAAASTVDVEMYLWDDDDVGRGFVAALAAAARRGVSVRVLVDAYGAGRIGPRLAEVSAAGGDVRRFNPFRLRFWRRYFHRTHRKMLLIDGGTAFTGGAGFSLHFSRGKHSERPWHDRMFEVRGPVVGQIEVAFESSFGRWDPVCAPCEGPDVEPPPPPPPAASGGSTLRVLRGWPDTRDFRPTVLHAIRGARERVWIGTPYFLPPRALRSALYAAAARGVDVRIVLPSAAHAHPFLHDAARVRYPRWLAKGVHLHEFQDAFYHAKTFVADRTLAIVGSSNLDSWSWSRNAELDLAVTDAATVDRVAALLEADRAASRAVTPEDARFRNLLRLVGAQVANAFEDWM